MLSLSDGNIRIRHSEKARVHPSVGKTLLTLFWNQRGEVMVDFVNKGATITRICYASLLKKLRKSIKTERRDMLARGGLTLAGQFSSS